MEVRTVSNDAGMAGLPFEIQQQIKTYVDAQLAREIDALRAQYEPAPPKELTPAERVSAAIAAARDAENGDKSVVSGSSRTHDAILTALELLHAEVFKDVNAGADADADAGPVVGVPVDSAADGSAANGQG